MILRQVRSIAALVLAWALILAAGSSASQAVVITPDWGFAPHALAVAYVSGASSTATTLHATLRTMTLRPRSVSRAWPGSVRLVSDRFLAAKAEEEGVSVFRVAHRGNGESELEHGLNPANHAVGDRSAYLGPESIAREFSQHGPYEDFYTEFKMLPDFEAEFAAHRFSYEGGRFEYQIPQGKIGRFNELTRARERAQP